MIGCDLLYDMLRSDPQFLNLLQRMKLDKAGPSTYGLRNNSISESRARLRP